MKKNLLIIAALFLAAGSLQAATITYSNSVSMLSEQDATVTLQKFDSATYGTLTGVYIEYVTSLANGSVAMDNDAVIAQNGTAKIRHINLAFTPGVTLLRDNFSSIAGSDLTISQQQLFALGATSGDAVGVFNATGESDYALWEPGNLTATGSGNIFSGVWGGYTGVGTFDTIVNAEINTTVTFTGLDGQVQYNTPAGTFSGKVIYTYTPVPEPATASMMGLAGLITLLVRRHLTK